MLLDLAVYEPSVFRLDFKCVVYPRKMVIFELNVDDGSYDPHDFSNIVSHLILL